MKRKKFEAGFKAKVAWEAAKGEKTLAQISSQYGVHPNVISRWKQELLSRLPGIFDSGKGNEKKEEKEQMEKLYKAIGELKIENDWLKKKLEILE
jgi:transposase-like protein